MTDALWSYGNVRHLMRQSAAPYLFIWVRRISGQPATAPERLTAGAKHVGDAREASCGATTDFTAVSRRASRSTEAPGSITKRPTPKTRSLSDTTVAIVLASVYFSSTILVTVVFEIVARQFAALACVSMLALGALTLNAAKHAFIRSRSEASK